MQCGGGSHAEVKSRLPEQHECCVHVFGLREAVALNTFFLSNDLFVMTFDNHALVLITMSFR